MSVQTSLFAEKLRAYRASNGTHGRMTQEELARLLDVSVDAISKYERSLSFVRGDLEHRLSENLGWSREEIVACREDWVANTNSPNRPAYQVLDEAALNTHFEGSWRMAAQASINFADSEFGHLPPEFEPNPDVFLEFYATCLENWGAVLYDGEMVAKWSLPFLYPEDEDAFREGRLIESELSSERFRRAFLPGCYFGYCPALIIRRGHEAATPLLLRSFVRFLENLAARDVFVRAMGTYSVSATGLQLCRDLGMSNLGTHVKFPDYGIWQMSGKDISRSLLARRSPKLRRAYSEQFGSGG